MKILLTATVQSHICQFHKPLAEVLHENGCEVHVAAKNNLVEKNGLRLDFVEKVYDVPFSRSPRSTDNVRAYKMLKKIIRDEKYDVIHCNTPVGGIVTRLAARKERRSGTRVYYTAHGFHFYKNAPVKNWLFYYPAERFMAHFTDKIITITEEDYELAQKRFSCESFHIHGVGLNTEKYSKASKEAVKSFREKSGWKDTYLILCTGELNENKNQKTVIEAVKILREKGCQCRLLLAGNGPDEEFLKKYTESLGLCEEVEFLGYRTDLEKYLCCCDAVVSASYREGLPMNILEAMYCGKPVVASDNRGHRELISSGENGFLVGAEEAAGFAERLIRLRMDEALCKRISREGRKKAMEYTDIKVKKELCAIYAVKEGNGLEKWQG